MWIALAITCAFANALWTALAKAVVQDVPPLRMTLILRAMVAVFLLVPSLWLAQFPAHPTFWLIVLAIGLLNGARWVIILHGVKRDYFSTYGMYNTAPLFTLLLAPTLLPERFGLAVWLGIIAIIGGGVVFYRTSRVSVYGLVGAVLTALVNILCKRGIDYADPLTVLFLMQLSMTAVLAIGQVSSRARQVRLPAWRIEFRRIAPLAAIVTVSALAFMYALSLDTATRVTAVARVNLIFGFLLSYLLLREREDWRWKLGGALLILVGTVAVAM